MAILFLPAFVQAQEEEGGIVYARRYLDINIRSQQKYNDRVSRQQDKLLARLKRREQHYAAKLKRQDSASFARYQQQSLTYDSISKISKVGDKPYGHFSGAKGSIDSLKRVQSYLADKIHLQGADNAGMDSYSGKLDGLQATGSRNDYINTLIGQRTTNLKQLNAGSKVKAKGISSIEKDVFYAKSKIKAFKDIKDEPSKAEEKALEYLQGQPDFDKYLHGNDGMQGLQGNMSSVDLEKMGFQTKQQVTANLQKKFGGNLSSLQQNMGTQVKQFQDNLNKLKSTQNTIKQSRRSLKQATSLSKPSFKINPMRGLPFSKRIERQYNYQTTRATIDGKPAMLQLSAMAGFKHTPKFTYGLGLATSIGLGQNWNNIRFSFEGLGLRSFASWQWQYGIGAYAGYERMYRKAVFINKGSESIPAVELNPHNSKTYTDAILIGLTKSYRINEKWNGSIQVLYDVWWKEKGLRSPIQLRFATMKK